MGWLTSTLTQSANILGLSPVIVGFVLARALGAGRAISSVVLAGLLTALLAAISAALAAQMGKPTALLSRYFYGAIGPRLVGAALAISLGGWFCVHTFALLQAMPPLLAGRSWSGGLRGSPWWWHEALVAVSAAMSLAIVWRGNERIARINAVQAPLLTLAVAYAASSQLGRIPWGTLTWQPHWPSVGLVVAAGLGDVVDMPAVLHRSKNRAAAMVAACLTYGAIVPLLLCCGVLLAATPGAESAIDALATGSPTWRTSLSLLAIGSALLGNAGLLYAGAWSLAAAFGAEATARWRLGQTLLALAMALSPLAGDLARLLDLLGLVCGALGLTMLTAYLSRPAALIPTLTAGTQQAHMVAAAVATASGFILLALSPDQGGLAVLTSCALAVVLTVCIRLRALGGAGPPGPR